MSMIKCPECGKEVSDKAYACPSCGSPVSPKTEPTPKKEGKKLTVIVIVILIIFISIVSSVVTPVYLKMEERLNSDAGNARYMYEAGQR